MVVEIPLGSAVKYELDKATGHVYVDRFQSMPVAAPANYGSFPRTIAADGDPLDAVMVSRHPVQAGAFVRVRPVGVLRTMDGQQPDDKILVVPVHDIDPTYDAVRDLKDVPRPSATASRPTSGSTSSFRRPSRAASSSRSAAKPRSPSCARRWPIPAAARATTLGRPRS